MQIYLHAIRTAAFILSIILFGSVAYAEEYYKWVDEDGVTHYGEALPSDETEHVAFEFPERYATSNANDDYYSIQNQLQRMLEWKQLQRRPQVQKEENLPPQTQPVQYEEPRYIVHPSLHHPINFPHLKNKQKHANLNKKQKHGCYGNDCYARKGIHYNSGQRKHKSGISTARSSKAKKSGIRSGAIIRTR